MPIHTNAAEIVMSHVAAHIYHDTGTAEALSPLRLNDTVGRFEIGNGKNFSTSATTELASGTLAATGAAR